MASTCCLPCGASGAARVTLDVGGHRYTTARSTLTTGRAEKSALPEILQGRCEQDGSYFLDRDGLQFPYILNYLRYGPDLFVPPDSTSARLTLAAEAKMLRLDELAKLLEIPDTHSEQNRYAVLELDTYFGAPLPQNEAARIAKLRSLNVIDTQNTDTEYDLITRCVAAIVDVPICLVSLVAEDKQWFKSKCGLPADETSRSSSFCAYTLVSDKLEDAAVLVVTDARRDLRFMRNPLVLGDPYIQFYCGVPLITSEGLRMGSLCSIDSKPREMSPKELGLQINFGYITVEALEHQQLEGRRYKEQVRKPEEEVHFRGGSLRGEALRDTGETGIVLVWARPDSMEWPLLYGNKVWNELTGVKVISPAKFPGKVEIHCEGEMPKVYGSGESFWDYVRMTPHGSAEVLELWKVVSMAMEGQRMDTKLQGLAYTVTLKAPRSKFRTLTCRLTPAELPLGEGAAVVKNHSLYKSTEKWPRPRGFAGDGHWFFVQMALEKENPNPQELVVSKTFSRQASPDEDTPLNVLKEEWDVLQTKPATPPFKDVRLVRLVGQGSFGAVYFSLWSGAAVACKVIRTVIPKKKGVEDVKAKPHFEAMLSKTISHPNLVQTFKHGGRVTEMLSNKGKAKTQVYETWIVQEWCDGGPLRGHCTKPRLEDERLLEAIQILLEIARAGQYLQDIGLIHGDLTCNNVLIKSMPVPMGFVCKVCDFGLARVLEQNAEEIHSNTLGTLTHMPPEMLNIAEKCSITMKADVYALGMIAYTVLMAEDPFKGLSAPQVVIQVVSKGKRPSLPEMLPSALLRAVQGMLQEDPKKRPSFGEIVNDFSQLIEDQGGSDDSLANLSEYRAMKSAPPSLA